MKKTQNFLEWNNEILVSAVKKINFGIVFITALDILFYFLANFLILFWHKGIEAKLLSFNMPQNLFALGAEEARQLTGDARLFFFMIALSFLLLLVAIILLASILKGIIWAKTTNTRLSFHLFSRFFVLNLLWMGFWFLLALLISWVIEPVSARVLIVIAALSALHFTNILYPLFMKEQKFSAVFSALRLGTAKVHLFLLPYASISSLLYLLIKAGSLLKFRYSPIALDAVLLAYMAITRYFISELVFSVKERK